MAVQISNNYNGQDSRALLEDYGFQVLGYSNGASDNDFVKAALELRAKLRDVAYLVEVPPGWTVKDQGQFHTAFHGPNGEELWSFIKYDPWDRHSFLNVHR